MPTSLVKISFENYRSLHEYYHDNDDVTAKDEEDEDWDGEWVVFWVDICSGRGFKNCILQGT